MTGQPHNAATVDPNTPAGASRRTRMWVAFVGLAVAAIVLVWGGWTVAQQLDYQQNARGFVAGDAFPWWWVVAWALFGVFAVSQAIRSRARYRRLVSHR